MLAPPKLLTYDTQTNIEQILREFEFKLSMKFAKDLEEMHFFMLKHVRECQDAMMYKFGKQIKALKS